jgi:hypothetical protein
VKPFDPALASAFRIEWLVECDQVTQDDLSRAIAEKAEPILRAARFIHAHQGADRTDMEIRVWVEAAVGPACVSITWEPGIQAFGFHLLDDSLRDRLAVVVFSDLPCVDADASEMEVSAILAAMHEAAELAETRTVRVPVIEKNPVDTGVDR